MDVYSVGKGRGKEEDVKNYGIGYNEDLEIAV